MNIFSALEIDVALTRYYIHITFVHLYVYIGVVAYLYSIVTVLCGTISVDKDSHTTVYCATTVASDVGEVITCGQRVVVLFNSCDLCSVRMYLIAGA